MNEEFNYHIIERFLRDFKFSIKDYTRNYKYIKAKTPMVDFVLSHANMVDRLTEAYYRDNT